MKITEKGNKKGRISIFILTVVFDSVSIKSDNKSSES